MKNLLRILLLACAVFLGMGLLTAQTEEQEVKSKTINLGANTSKMIPLCGGKADNYCKCEFVVPASSLSFMKGNLVKEIRFKSNTGSPKQWGSARFRVFVKEIEKSELSDYQGLDNSTIVFDGSLASDNFLMAVPFSTPYEYKGGNLLIGVYQISPGSKAKLSFYGVEAKGASIVGWNKEGLDNITAANSSIIDFCPEMTFLYQAKPVRHYVDFGLPSGTLWAVSYVNTGKDNHNHSYDFFRWGDTLGRYTNDYSRYKFYDESSLLIKYCDDWQKGRNSYVDNLLNLETKDDAASVKWGDDWQMPTKEQIEELVRYTVWENGEILSLRNGRVLKIGGAQIWSNTIVKGDPNKAYCLDLTNNRVEKKERKDICKVLPVKAKARSVEKFDPHAKRTIDTEEHEYVDLGLPSGTLWATCNIGAKSPEDVGDYYAWGETDLKWMFNKNTYVHYDHSNGKLKKYCKNRKFGKVDNLRELEPEDDVATYRWGSAWCMPTKEQCQELLDNTVVGEFTENGVKGYLFRARNGNTLFIPFTSYKAGTSLADDVDEYGFCNIWTKTLCPEGRDPGCSMSAYCGRDWTGLLYGGPETAFVLALRTKKVVSLDRLYGVCVRPVRSVPK